MKTQIKNLDDVVFEKRNKNYGAYYLRKAYSKFLSCGLSVTIGAVSLIVLIPFLVYKQAHSVNIDKDVSAEFIIADLPKPIVLPPPPPPPDTRSLERRMRLTTPILVKEDVDNMLNQDIINDQPQSDDPVITGGEETPVEKKQPEVIEPALPPFTPLQVEPSFEGGEGKLFEWLGKNIVYPPDAIQVGIEGTVVVIFVVEKDGSITNAQLLKKIGGGCDEEVLRIMKIMPKWKPGIQNSVHVRVQFILPVRFNLEK